MWPLWAEHGHVDNFDELPVQNRKILLLKKNYTMQLCSPIWINDLFYSVGNLNVYSFYSVSHIDGLGSVKNHWSNFEAKSHAAMNTPNTVKVTSLPYTFTLEVITWERDNLNLNLTFKISKSECANTVNIVLSPHPFFANYGWRKKLLTWEVRLRHPHRCPHRAALELLPTDNSG